MSELICRHLQRSRPGGRTTKHEFITRAWIFDPYALTDAPPYIRRLQQHLMQAFMEGCPQRPVSASQAGCHAAQDFTVTRVDSRLTYMAQAAAYHDWGKEQHDAVQYYLHRHDPYTWATEVPVWTPQWSGLMDQVRVLPGLRVEIGDFKPDLPKTPVKNCPAYGDTWVPTTKKLTAICSQLTHYWQGLRDACDIPPAKLTAVAYNDVAAFQLTKHPQ